MPDQPTLYLIATDKRRPDDYDVRAEDRRLVGRIYKYSHAPTGKWWFWAVQIFPAVASDSGSEETREAAMAGAARGLGEVGRDRPSLKRRWLIWAKPRRRAFAMLQNTF